MHLFLNLIVIILIYDNKCEIFQPIKIDSFDHKLLVLLLDKLLNYLCVSTNVE